MTDFKTPIRYVRGFLTKHGYLNTAGRYLHEKKDEPLPSIPDRECRSGISTPVEYHSFGTPKRPLSRIRAWRSPDVEQQTAEWRRAHARPCYDLDQYWKIRMRNRP